MNVDSIKHLLKKTGWQSWTGSVKKFPRFNYPPYEYDYKVELPNSLVKKSPIKGWASWAHYGTSINEKEIFKQLDWIENNKQLGLEYILIDDGWTTWGDWGTADIAKFPNGLFSITSKIENKGLKSGIWIAPFLVHPDSTLVRNHPEWLVYYKGAPVDGLKALGLRITPFKRYLLDIENPEVIEYLNKTLAILFTEYKFKLVKLDFLYSIYFDPRRSPEISEKLLRNFLINFKESYPDVYSIACGCPLNPAIGNVDSFRIYKDNFIFSYLPLKLRSFLYPLKRLYSISYTRGLAQNYKERLWTKDFWNLDLDSFICQGTFGFSDYNIHKLCTLIKNSTGNIFLGDDLTKLSKSDINKYIKKLLLPLS